jgi:hypothetical protein
VVEAYSEEIYGLPEDPPSSSGHICNHRAFCTVYGVKQEYPKEPDDIDLRYPPLSATAVPTVCTFLDPLNIARLSLTLVIVNPGVPGSLFTVRVFTAKTPNNSHCKGRVLSGFWK